MFSVFLTICEWRMQSSVENPLLPEMQKVRETVKLQVYSFHSAKFSLGLSICLQINICQSFTSSVCFQKAYMNII